MTTCIPSASTVAFEEYEIFPAPHPQQDAPDEGEVMRIGRVDGNLSCSAARNVVAGGILIDID
jgi:hypothetical protein